MNSMLKLHKGSAIVMSISTVACIWSGAKGNMKLHKKCAAVMAVSGLLCMYSGYRLVHPAKPMKRVEKEASAPEELSAENIESTKSTEESTSSNEGDTSLQAEGTCE